MKKTLCLWFLWAEWESNPCTDYPNHPHAEDV